ncbi:hypothetical protein BG006_004911 [Podila minutissima]|uniref:Uncharacterized protein n=1 Tax=Podila minutissima TaxID=64525 RepID=A0A9P5VM30_9FUNG|nr:hypothetical protein BG006_004911 [Podila minutissima]
MASPATQDQQLFQTFKTQKDEPLSSRAAQRCDETGKSFVLWSEIQKAFVNINYLQDWQEERVLFMIDKCGKLYLPLRVEHNPDETYTVVNILPSQTVTALERLFDICEHLYERLENAPNMARATFQQIAANTRYQHELLQRDITRLDADKVKIQVGGWSREKIERRFNKLEQKVPDWNHQNICFNMFHGVQTKWDYATSKLFIVLPADGDSWDDRKPSTHNFRLHFLCDNRKDDLSLRSMTQHVHLANHHGYNLLRPQDFFEEYGDYVLRVLRMVKKGYAIPSYEIPPMDTNKILWKCDVIGNNVTKVNIAYLVDKSISYLEEYSPPARTMEPGLTRNQSAGIKDFLDVQPGENTEGSLHRHIDSEKRVTWKCKVHQLQYFNPKPLTALTTFVQDHEGDIDMQQTTVRAVLRSSEVADQFRTLLKSTQQIFNLNLKLDLKASRVFLRDFCLDVARSKAVALDIDGVTLETHPQGYVQYAHNLFADKVVPDCELQIITLTNYPRPQEQCLHLGRFSLQTPTSLSRPARSWVDLITDLEKVHSLVSLADVASDCDRAVIALQTALENHGYPRTTLVTIHESGWSTVFCPQEGGLVEVYSQDAACPKGVYTSGYIRKMTVDLRDLEFDKNFFHLVQTNTSLQELNVSYHGHNVLFYIESIVRMWHESSSPFRLTLIDRLEDTRGRVVAHMNIRGCGSDRSGGSTLEVDCTDGTSSSTQGDQPEAPTEVQFPKWECDQISAKPSDFAASILDAATEQHPEVLNSLTLDTSELSPKGLGSVTNLLGRSDLDHLNIVCNPFDAGALDSIAQVLDSVQCDALKSLVFSGSNIDGWVQLWPPTGSPKLIQLGIHGPGSTKQELSHPSVLAIHQMVHASPLIDLAFTNVELQDPRDWALITGALHPESLKTFDMCDRAKAQFESCPEAVDILNKFPGRPSLKVPSATITSNQAPVVKNVPSKRSSPTPPVDEVEKSENTGSTVPVKEDAVSEPSFWQRWRCCCCGGGRK